MASFEFNGRTYEYDTRLIDTDCGPEREVSIYLNGHLVATMCECASAKTQVGWWMAEETELALESEGSYLPPGFDGAAYDAWQDRGFTPDVGWRAKNGETNVSFSLPTTQTTPDFDGIRRDQSEGER